MAAVVVVRNVTRSLRSIYRSHMIHWIQSSAGGPLFPSLLLFDERTTRRGGHQSEEKRAKTLRRIESPTIIIKRDEVLSLSHICLHVLQPSQSRPMVFLDHTNAFLGSHRNLMKWFRAESMRKSWWYHTNGTTTTAWCVCVYVRHEHWRNTWYCMRSESGRKKEGRKEESIYRAKRRWRV